MPRSTDRSQADWILSGHKCDAGYSEPAGGWKWISGKTTTGYTNWAGGEPNNSGAGEDWAQISCSAPTDGSFWNDYGDGLLASTGIIERQSLDGKIPAVSEWCLVVMTLLIAAAGTVVLMKSRNRAA